MYSFIVFAFLCFLVWSRPLRYTFVTTRMMELKVTVLMIDDDYESVNVIKLSNLDRQAFSYYCLNEILFIKLWNNISP